MSDNRNPLPKPGYYYEHTLDGSVHFKPSIVVDMGGGPREYFDSPYVKRWWVVEKPEPTP